jgi:hypothetical protein
MFSRAISVNNHVLQDPSAALDDRGRADVEFVAGHENLSEPDAVGEPKRLTKDVTGIATAAKGRTDGVADVPAYRGEVRRQLMPNRYPADEYAIDLGDQERRRHPARQKVATRPRQFESVQIVRPRSTLRSVQQEFEAIARQLPLSPFRFLLIIDLQWP